MPVKRAKIKRRPSSKTQRVRGKSRPLAARIAEAEGERLALEERQRLRKLRDEIKQMRKDLLSSVADAQ